MNQIEDRRVRVKIPVVVDKNGRWRAWADSSVGQNESNDEVMEAAEELGFHALRHIRFVYTLVPVIKDFIKANTKLIRVSRDG